MDKESLNYTLIRRAFRRKGKGEFPRGLMSDTKVTYNLPSIAQPSKSKTLQNTLRIGQLSIPNLRSSEIELQCNNNKWEHTLRDSCAHSRVTRSRTHHTQPTHRPAGFSFLVSDFHKPDRSAQVEKKFEGSISIMDLSSTAPALTTFVFSDSETCCDRERLFVSANLDCRRKALATIEKLLLPLWKFYRHKQQLPADDVMQCCALREVNRFRKCMGKKTAAGSCRSLVSQGSRKHINNTQRLHRQVTKLQRLFRHHSLRMKAAIELNFLKLRQYEETTYWVEVVSKREGELLKAFNDAYYAFDGIIEEITTKHISPQAAKQNVFFKSHLPSYELDVSNYFIAGPLPEHVVRNEIKTALIASLRRAVVESIAHAYTQHDFITGTLFPTIQSRKMQPISASEPSAAPRMPVFLPYNIIRNILDNSCYITSQIRSDPLLRAHLRERERFIVPY